MINILEKMLSHGSITYAIHAAAESQLIISTWQFMYIFLPYCFVFGMFALIILLDQSPRSKCFIYFSQILKITSQTTLWPVFPLFLGAAWHALIQYCCQLLLYCQVIGVTNSSFPSKQNLLLTFTF
jgi:ABC-type multidrug transport system permease subunit